MRFERKAGMANICSKKSTETAAEKVFLCLLLLYLEINSGHTKEILNLTFYQF